MDALFDEIDRDGDGTISKEEFSKMYDGIRNAVLDEHDKFTRSNRRARLLCAITAVLIPVVVILLAGNTGLVWWMIKLNKDMHVSNSALVNTNDEPVSTAKLMTHFDLQNIPSLGAEYDYSSMESVKLQVPDPETNNTGTLNLRVIGSYWYNVTDVDLFLETGLSLHISKGAMRLAPTLLNQFGVTPSDQRRKLFAFGGVGLAIFLGAAYVAMNYDKMGFSLGRFAPEWS